MTERCAVSPDMEFIQDVMDNGGESLKKCYQCATCSVVCPISPEDEPFPRKEVIWASWGMKERIFNRPDIWLCHQCNDCSVHCPRGVKPGNVVSALRNLFIRHYTFPAYFHRMLHDPKKIGQVLAIPSAILLLIILVLWGAGMLGVNPTHAADPENVHYSKMLPHLALNAVFTFLIFLVFLVFASAIFRFWTAMARSAGISCTVNIDSLKLSILPALKEIATHEKFSECGHAKSRYISHMLVLFGFIGLLIVTAVAVMYIVFGGQYPLGWGNIFKILGNVSGFALVIGVGIMAYERLYGANKDKIGTGTYYDWLFLGVLGTVGVTGLLLEVMRYANIAPLAYSTYFIHLVAVFILLMFSPYSKLAHVVYRTEAIIFSKYAALEKERGTNVCEM